MKTRLHGSNLRQWRGHMEAGRGSARNASVGTDRLTSGWPAADGRCVLSWPRASLNRRAGEGDAGPAGAAGVLEPRPRICDPGTFGRLRRSGGVAGPNFGSAAGANGWKPVGTGESDGRSPNGMSSRLPARSASGSEKLINVERSRG